MADPITVQLIFFLLATSSSKNLDRSELAVRIKDGDHSAFRAFFEAHHQNLFRFLRSKNLDRVTAEDLIQQAFVYIWEHRLSIDPSKSLRSYLFRIAYTRMLNHFRDNKKFDESEPVPVREHVHTPEDAARANELHHAISKAIDQMPEKRSQVFELCFMEQFTYKEAAEVMDVSVKTIENHMALAFKDMRRALEDFI